MAKGLFSKILVPDQSTLHVKVSPVQPPPPDRWTADLFLRDRSGTLLAHSDDAQLRAGVQHRLQGKNPAYVMGQLVLTFAGPSKAQVEMVVKKPDGSPHGKPYREAHSSAPADSVLIVVFMA